MVSVKLKGHRHFLLFTTDEILNVIDVLAKIHDFIVVILPWPKKKGHLDYA